MTPLAESLESSCLTVGHRYSCTVLPAVWNNISLLQWGKNCQFKKKNYNNTSRTTETGMTNSLKLQRTKWKLKHTLGSHEPGTSHYIVSRDWVLSDGVRSPDVLLHSLLHLRSTLPRLPTRLLLNPHNTQDELLSQTSDPFVKYGFKSLHWNATDYARQYKRCKFRDLSGDRQWPFIYSTSPVFRYLKFNSVLVSLALFASINFIKCLFLVLVDKLKLLFSERCESLDMHFINDACFICLNAWEENGGFMLRFGIENIAKSLS